MITFKIQSPYPPLGAAGGLLHMNILLIFAFLLGGCNTHEPIAMPIDNPDYSIIDGDTVKTVKTKDFDKIKDKYIYKNLYSIVGDTTVNYKKPKLHTQPSKLPDLTKIKNNDDPELKGKPLRMVVIGGGVAAGVRDGGYFNEGIETSYPNLLARQMGISFNQPYFDAQDYNGISKHERSGFNPTGGPLPKLKLVTNNLAVESANDSYFTLKKPQKFETDNFAFWNNSLGHSYFNRTANASYFDDDDQRSDKRTNLANQVYRRLIPKDGKSAFSDVLKSKKFDFILLDFFSIVDEKGFNDWINWGWPSGGPEEEYNKYIETQTKFDNLHGYIYERLPKELLILNDLQQSKMLSKGVIYNIPNYRNFPFYNYVTPEMVTKMFGSTPVNTVEGTFGSSPYPVTLMATSTIDSLLSPKVNIALKKGIYPNPPVPFTSISSSNHYRQDWFDAYTQKTQLLAKRYNLAMVDLYSLYDKILRKSYFTDDGIFVDSAYPNGNFFSSDGRYPTAFGQAVIANETIKAINLKYGMSIPLIATREYLTK
jgi:hypothetical protein